MSLHFSNKFTKNNSLVYYKKIPSFSVKTELAICLLTSDSLVVSSSTNSYVWATTFVILTGATGIGLYSWYKWDTQPKAEIENPEGLIRPDFVRLYNEVWERSHSIEFLSFYDQYYKNYTLQELEYILSSFEADYNFKYHHTLTPELEFWDWFTDIILAYFW